jgi:uncharacterized repeat protein (TIGR02543 family)
MATGYDYDATLIVYKNDGTSANYEINKSGRAGQQGYGFTVYVSFYSSESYTRDGYNFIGYKQDNVSSNPMYYPGDSVPFGFGAGGGSQTQRFYCQWQLKTYTISYNANGGSGAPSSQTKTHGTNITLSSTVPTRTNYTFQGWATSSTGAVQYQPGATFTTNANTTLYAVWAVAAATLNSVSNTTIGSSGTASWTKVNNSHTYKLTLSMSGASSVNVNVSAGSSSTSFTIPNSWLSALPNSTSATATAVLYTYNGSTLVGSTQKTFTVSVASSVKPSISSFTSAPHSNNATVEGWGVAVQGYSYLTLSVSATAGTGSSISNISFSGHGISQSSTSTSGNTAVVTSTGSLTYTVTVKDSRGRTESTTLTVTSYAYSNPEVSSLMAVRCLSDGTQSDTEGGYIKAYPVFVFSSVNGNNSLTVKKIEYKQHDSSTWTEVTAAAVSGSWTSVFGPADITKTFDVRCTVTDAVGNTYVLSVSVSPVVGFSLGLKNDRARFGGPVEKAGLQVDWPAEFNDAVDITNRRCSATLSSAGWYRVMQTKDVSGTIIDFRIGRPYGANQAEAHKISFYIVGGGKSAFLDETSDTNTLCVDKIRATYDGVFMYFDVHYNASSANEVLVYFDVYGKGQANGTSIAMGLASVADAPAGETVLETHNFSANASPVQTANVSSVLRTGTFTPSDNELDYTATAPCWFYGSFVMQANSRGIAYIEVNNVRVYDFDLSASLGHQYCFVPVPLQKGDRLYVYISSNDNSTYKIIAMR